MCVINIWMVVVYVGNVHCVHIVYIVYIVYNL